MGQWASGGLGGDEGVDLFEFDDVGPVGGDPVPPGVLGVGGGEQLVVQFARAEVGVGEPLDEGALVGRRGLHELFEFGAPFDELGGGAHDQWGVGLVVAVGEPAAVLERAQHQLLPSLRRVRIVGTRSETGDVVGDVVEEPVVGDAGGCVVPHGGAGRVGGSGAEPGGQPAGLGGAKLVGGTVDGDVDGTPVQVGVAGFDTEGGQLDRPILSCVGDGIGETGKRRGGGR